MTDDPILADDPHDDRGAVLHPPRRRGRRAVVIGLVLLVLGAIAFYLLARPELPGLHLLSPHADADADAPPAAPMPFDAGRVVELATQLDQLRQRVAVLEQRLANQQPTPAVPSGPPATPPAITSADATALDTRLDALASRQDQLANQLTTTDSQTADRLNRDEARLEAAANQAVALAAVTDRAARLARVQAAQTDLAQGLPLGQIPDAPPALARFHTDAPPTEAQLRLGFPAAARTARAAARPDVARLGFWNAMRARLESLITIRRGDRILVGDPQIGLLDQARTELDAGDLQGSVDTLGQLTGPAADAMAAWRDQARALLEARAALAKLASQS